MRRGVYADGASWAALAPWDRYLARVHAVALTRASPVFCLESAAALLGLPVFGEPTHVHVFDTTSPTSHRSSDVVAHTSRDPREPVGEDILITSPADTVLDLCRVLPPAYGLAVMDAAISPEQTGLCDLAGLIEWARPQANRRGIRRVEWTLRRCDPRAESTGESVSRAVIEWLGYPDPDLQRVFRQEGVTDRVDFFWEESRVIGESDGYGKYRADDPEETRRRLIDEKRREDRLRRHARGFVRWDWADAVNVDGLAAKLARAGLPLARRPQHALLSTLRRNPRSTPRGARRVVIAENERFG